MKSFIFIASINNEHKKTSLKRGILPLWWGKMPTAWATYPNDIYNAMVHFAPTDGQCFLDFYLELEEEFIA